MKWLQREKKAEKITDESKDIGNGRETQRGKGMSHSSQKDTYALARRERKRESALEERGRERLSARRKQRKGECHTTQGEKKRHS